MFFERTVTRMLDAVGNVMNVGTNTLQRADYGAPSRDHITVLVGREHANGFRQFAREGGEVSHDYPHLFFFLKPLLRSSSLGLKERGREGPCGPLSLSPPQLKGIWSSKSFANLAGSARCGSPLLPVLSRGEIALRTMFSLVSPFLST